MARGRFNARARARAQWGKVLRLGGATWEMVAVECGYKSAGSAYVCVLYHADDEAQRQLLMAPPWREALLLERWARRAVREMGSDVRRGMRTGAINCFRCGKLKSRPSTRCDWCGDDPVTHNGDAREFDRAYGYG